MHLLLTQTKPLPFPDSSTGNLPGFKIQIAAVPSSSSNQVLGFECSVGYCSLISHRSAFTSLCIWYKSWFAVQHLCMFPWATLIIKMSLFWTQSTFWSPESGLVPCLSIRRNHRGSIVTYLCNHPLCGFPSHTWNIVCFGLVVCIWRLCACIPNIWNTWAGLSVTLLCSYQGPT